MSAYPEHNSSHPQSNVYEGTGSGYPHRNHHQQAGMGPQSNPLHPNAGTGMSAQPNTAHNPVTSSGKSPQTQATIGKVERTIGKIVGSQNLQAKGLAKEQEARAVQAQRTEIANAEHLEAQAGLARDRANVHAAQGNVHGSVYNTMGTHGATGMNAPAIPPTSMGVQNPPGTQY